MTALKDKLQKAGIDPREVELQKAIALWQNRGGTLSRLWQIARKAYGADQTALETQSRLVSAESGGTASLALSKDHISDAVPVRAHERSMPGFKEPSPSDLAAARKVKKQVARTIWDTMIGGERRIGGTTKLDWINLSRKFDIAGHIARRMVTEVAWPDDDRTPLESVASEKQVKAILESGPAALRMMENTHA